MTAIEFFDRTPIENIISSLTTLPDKIIYIGEERLLNSFLSFYDEFRKNRGIQIEVEYRSIDKNNINSIFETLSNIVENEDECVFDLTGGEDLVLVAMGMVYMKYRDSKKVKMQRFNIQKGDTVDCDNDGEFIYSGAPQISVEECIRLHGGTIRYKTDDSRDGTLNLEITEEFAADIDRMWNICRENPGAWNKQFIILELLNKDLKEKELEVCVQIDTLKEKLNSRGIKYFSIDWFLKRLSRAKLISGYNSSNSNIKFRYKNRNVKIALSSAGTVLELKVLKTGNKFYSDAKSGVYIDWDGKFHKEETGIKDTENEIDVILMKGIIPIFISCKNGEIDDDELYKFDAVASRFGGLYVKKVLIATYLNKKPESMKHFRQRARDMKINFIDDVHNLTDEKFEKIIRGL